MNIMDIYKSKLIRGDPLLIYTLGPSIKKLPRVEPMNILIVERLSLRITHAKIGEYSLYKQKHNLGDSGKLHIFQRISDGAFIKSNDVLFGRILNYETAELVSQDANDVNAMEELALSSLDEAEILTVSHTGLLNADTKRINDAVNIEAFERNQANQRELFMRVSRWTQESCHPSIVEFRKSYGRNIYHKSEMDPEVCLCGVILKVMTVKNHNHINNGAKYFGCRLREDALIAENKRVAPLQVDCYKDANCKCFDCTFVQRDDKFGGYSSQYASAKAKLMKKPTEFAGCDHFAWVEKHSQKRVQAVANIQRYGGNEKDFKILKTKNGTNHLKKQKSEHNPLQECARLDGINRMRLAELQADKEEVASASCPEAMRRAHKIKYGVQKYLKGCNCWSTGIKCIECRELINAEYARNIDPLSEFYTKGIDDSVRSIIAEWIRRDLASNSPNHL